MQKDIVIEVWETGTVVARTFECKIAVEGKMVVKRRLTPIETMEAKDMSAQYASLFSDGKKYSKHYLQLLGVSLFQLFFQPSWQELGPEIISGGRLIVASKTPEILQLPWELLRLPGEEVLTIGLSKEFAVLRLPGKGSATLTSSLPFPLLSPPSHELRAGPLRMLFLSANPHDFEVEELSISKALEGLDIHLEICDKTTFKELESLVGAFQPHLVYLSGETNLSGRASAGEAKFTFMDQAGKPDMRSAEELASALKSGETECIILGGGRKNGPDPARDLLCQRLAEHLLMAVAWNGPVSSPNIFRSLSSGASVHESLLNAARKMLQKGIKEKEEQEEQEEDDGEKVELEAYPVLYVSLEPTALFDPEKSREDMIIRYQELPPMPGMTEGHAEGFVNRKNELHRLYPDLKKGAIDTLFITGQPGSGKSTLANHLARLLAASGFFILPLAGTAHNPISSARLLEAAGLQLAVAGEYKGLEKIKRLRDPSLPIPERLNALLELLKSSHILIFWDDLNLDSKTGRISDPFLGEFYQQMVKGLRSSRAIISCPRIPSDVPILPHLARNWELDKLSRAAFMRFILRKKATRDIYREGEISFDGLNGLYSLYEKDPSRLNQIRRVLAEEMPLKDGDPLARLILSLKPESLYALRQLSVYDTAMSPAGFAAAARTTPEKIAESLPIWEELSLAYKTTDLWALPSSLRTSLLAGLSQEERRDAHKSAGRFLEEMAESGSSHELSLSRLDCLQGARGHYLEAGYQAAAKRTTARISNYLDRRGHSSEVIRLNQELLELQPDPETMNWIAKSYAHQSNPKKAADWYQRALEISLNATSYQGLGMAQLGQQEYDKAEESLKNALQIYVVEKDRLGEAASLQALALIDRAKMSTSAALDKLEKAASILDSLGDRLGEATVLQDMAGLDMAQHHYESARSRLARSLKLIKDMGDRAGEAVLLFNLANADRERGELDLAEKELICALDITRDLGDRKGVAASLHGLGMISSQAGEMEMAAEHFREALKVYQELGDQPGEAGALFQLGALAVQMDRIQEGLRLMALSAVVLRSINSDEVKNIEPVVERLASQLDYNQDKFIAMLQEVMDSYVKDRGRRLIDRAFGK